MSKRKLTDTQWLMLGYMLNSNDICYSTPGDRTMKALGNAGLVRFLKGGKYSKDHWIITDRAKAVEMLSEKIK